MIPLVTVVGRSNSGKTTLLERLTGELIRRGYRVATIKHCAHHVDIDRPGSDSDRHQAAGAVATIMTAPGEMVIRRRVSGDIPLADLRDWFRPGEADLVLAEGFKGDHPFPRLEAAFGVTRDALVTPPGPALVAVVSDHDPGLSATPWIHSDDIPAVADLLEKRYLARSGARGETTLIVNGRRIPMKGFVRDMLHNVVMGAVGSLKECGHATRVEITILNPQQAKNDTDT